MGVVKMENGREFWAFMGWAAGAVSLGLALRERLKFTLLALSPIKVICSCMFFVSVLKTLNYRIHYTLF